MKLINISVAVSVPLSSSSGRLKRKSTISPIKPWDSRVLGDLFIFNAEQESHCKSHEMQ